MLVGLDDRDPDDVERDRDWRRQGLRSRVAGEQREEGGEDRGMGGLRAEVTSGGPHPGLRATWNAMEGLAPTSTNATSTKPAVGLFGEGLAPEDLDVGGLPIDFITGRMSL